MNRPLRLEFPGALYHVTSRGDRMERIYQCDADRLRWLHIMGETAARFNFIVHSFCQMTNHYHVLLETVDGNLAQGMRHLNGVYTQAYNRKHTMTGHLFQGRYKAILVQKETYLLALLRYIALNPLRAQMVASADDWPWSSHRVVIGAAVSPCWLDTDGLLQHFGVDRPEAISAYRQFIQQGIGLASPLGNVHHQYLLGDAAFDARFQSAQVRAPLGELSRNQRRVGVLSLPAYAALFPDREEAMSKAYHSTAYTMAEIGRHFSVSYKTASRTIRCFDAKTPIDKT